MSKRTLIFYDPSLNNDSYQNENGIIVRGFKKYLNYNVKIIAYINSCIKFLDDGIEILDINNKEEVDIELQNCDALMTWGYFYDWFKFIYRYKNLNPSGKVYLKLGMNPFWFNNLGANPPYLDLVKEFDLISIECERLKYIIEEKWNLDLEYIPNGYYELNDDRIIEFEEKENTIVTVTDLGDPIKGVDTLLNAFALCANRIKGWSLKLIGNIDESFLRLINGFYWSNPSLEERVSYYDISCVNLEDEYRRAKIFCLPSQNESFPNAFSYATSKGCYIISSNLHVAYDITDYERVGSIFTANNSNELKDILVKVCNSNNILKKVCYETQIYCRNNFDMVRLCYKIHELLNNNSNTIYLIGNNQSEWFKNNMNNSTKNRKFYFNASKEFVESDYYKRISSGKSSKNENLKNIVVCDEENFEKLKEDKLLKGIKYIYKYSEINDTVKSALNNIEYSYGNKYYSNYDYYFLESRLNLLKEDNTTKIIVTGLSYALYGIDETLLKYKSCNLALPSEDIYYAYKIAKEVIVNNDNIEYCIIGLGYYSLHFDLSKCSENFRVEKVYYPIFGDSHHHVCATKSLEYKGTLLNNFLNSDLVKILNTSLIEENFKKAFYRELCRCYFKEGLTRGDICGANYKLNELSHEECEELAVKCVESRNNLIKHNDTVNENIEILKEFLGFLKKEGVKPIICVFPNTSYYNKYINKEFESILCNCINELSSIYDFSLVDLNTYDEFNLSDFVDMHHLNYEGAVKATNILNSFIH